uniref:PGG domain-containing protein n=1 Tax=Aegilops tauschii TaxID=37682 RepID=M8B0N0_AEGTA
MGAQPTRHSSLDEIEDLSQLQPNANGNSQGEDPQPPETESYELMRDLSKYILLLATLVATLRPVAASDQLAGDSIIRTTSYGRYLVFFYCNATAFASSLVIIVLVLFLTLLKKQLLQLKPLQAVMVVDLLSVMGAYAAGTCRDKTTTIYSSVLVVVVIAYLTYQMVMAWRLPDNENRNNDARAAVDKKRLRKVLMLLATFAVSVTYVAGMSTPGGFWDNTENGHRPGDAILKDSHDKRLTVFLCFNTMAFVASLLIIVVLLDRKPRENEAYGCIAVALISLVGAYTAGSCRETDTTIYVSSLVGAVLIFMALLQGVVYLKGDVAAAAGGAEQDRRTSCFRTTLTNVQAKIAGWLQSPAETGQGRDAAQQARSLVLLLATLAATITYQAGLDPPGGVWPDNKNGHMAGDPILLTVNAGRYKAFYYCNSVAFVASLVAIILVQSKVMLETHVLEAAMVLDLFGLIGAYAAGSSRDLSTSIYAMALAGAVLVYVVIHVVFFTLNHGDPTPEEIKSVDKRRKRLLLFAVLAATITYQAGLTPPGGVRLQDDGSSGHQAGDPVLFYNFPRRYTAFFYCNSVSFMLSIALIILLVNPHLYRPAIRSYALAVCTGAGMFGLMGAYAAGSTQHLKTSIYIFVLGAVVLFVIAVLLLVFLDNRNANVTSQPRPENDDDEERKTKQAKRKYLMLLGILVASVTYQAGLDPPGGAWQHSGSGYDAGNPIMHDNQRHRYLAFFYSNSTSFVASIVVIIILLLEWKDGKRWSLKVMNTTIVLDLLALLVAYAAGSSRGWKTSVYVVALVIAVLAYVAVHIVLAISCCHSPREENSVDPARVAPAAPIV